MGEGTMNATSSHAELVYLGRKPKKVLREASAAHLAGSTVSAIYRRTQNTVSAPRTR